jgi:autoinducer 2-degrading protein
MFVVTVDFEIHPEHFDSFMRAMVANAHASLDLEVNCLQFDVCTSDANQHHVFLYEVYQDALDFQAHLQMPHFLLFNEQSAPQVISKKIQTFHRAFPLSPLSSNSPNSPHLPHP